MRVGDALAVQAVGGVVSGGRGGRTGAFNQRGRAAGASQSLPDSRRFAQAQEHLRTLHGPRVPELLRLLKESWLPPVCPLTPALLERWRSGAKGDFQLPPAAQVRLIALVEPGIPCWPDPPKARAPHSRGEPSPVERWLESYLKKHGGAVAVSSAFADILNEPGWEDLEPEGFLAELKTLRRLIVDFANPEVPWLRLG